VTSFEIPFTLRFDKIVTTVDEKRIEFKEEKEEREIENDSSSSQGRSCILKMKIVAESGKEINGAT
jgi:hypothetical protein